MKILTVNQAMTLFILIMLVLICGFSGISYGEDALTILDVQCEADGIPGDYPFCDSKGDYSRKQGCGKYKRLVNYQRRDL